jgi:hypothetical protein
MLQRRITMPRRRLAARLVLAILLPAALGLSCPSARAETPESPYAVELKTGAFVPADGDYAAGLAELAAHAASGGAHLFVQMRDIPTAPEREALAARGIALLDYLPENTWYARVSSALDGAGLRAAGVRWIGPLRFEHKVSERVLASEFSSWSEYDGGRRIYVVQMHSDVPQDRGREVLGVAADLIGGYIHSIHTFVVALAPEQIATLALADEVRWIDERPPVLSVVNDGVRASIGVNTVQSAPYGLNGAGTTVMVYDAGLVGTHPDFGNRVTLGESGSVANHSTHVAGSVGGDGTNSGGTYKGMAPACHITSYLYEACNPNCLYNSPQDIEENYAEGLYTHGDDMASNSLGANIAPNGYPCSWEGDYETTAQLLDAICNGSLGTPFLSLWAAGNERAYGNCGTGYSTTGVPATAKNPIVVGATNSNDHSMTYFSSWGPVDDGRIRPDICAPGCQVGGDGGITSTMPGGGYGAMCGTSMATPVTSGVSALMLQQMRRLFGPLYRPLPSTMKALLVNTAQDYGNVGPDFQFGYGEIRPQAGADAIRGRFALLERTLDQGDEEQFQFSVETGLPVLQVTVAWSDVPGAQLAQHELVNDLDIYLEAPSGTHHNPWILDPANPSAPATRGADHRNPMEQVTVTSPQAGLWTLHVAGTTVPEGPQQYSVVASLPLDESSSVETGDRASSPASVQTGLSRPNPSRGATAIEYSVARAGNVRLVIRDVSGRTVRALDLSVSTPGAHQATWDGLDESGRAVPSGIYFYRAEDASGGGSATLSRSLLLLR